MHIHRAAVMSLSLLFTAPALAQEASPRPPAVAPEARRGFALGSAFQYGSVLCFECGDAAAPGISGGFELGLTEDVWLVGEGVWTGGYTPSPFVRHEHFVYADVKIRYALTEMRHRPYVLVGLAAMWDRDARTVFYGLVDGEAVHLPAPEVRVETRTALGLATGFGWSFRVGERWEIRPELQAYFGSRNDGWAYSRTAVGVWYRF